MTKAELIDALRDYPNNSLVVIEVHDTMLSEDLYDFTLDAIDMVGMQYDYELRLTAINHHEKLIT